MGSNIYLTTSTPSEHIIKTAEDFKIPVHLNNRCKGISGDWTYAYSLCETDYVTLAHQDDLYLPDYTIRFVESAEKCSDNIITFCDYFQLQGNDRCSWNINLAVKRVLLLPFILKKNWRTPLVRKLILTFGNPICCPSVMYHKSRMGNFTFSQEYTYNLDWDAWIRLASEDGHFSYLNSPLICHRIHAESQTSLQTTSNRRSEEELKCLKRLMPDSLAMLYSRLYKFGEFSNRVKSDE